MDTKNKMIELMWRCYVDPTCDTDRTLRQLYAYEYRQEPKSSDHLRALRRAAAQKEEPTQPPWRAERGARVDDSGKARYPYPGGRKTMDTQMRQLQKGQEDLVQASQQEREAMKSMICLLYTSPSPRDS